MNLLRIALVLILIPFNLAQAVVIRLNENASVCGAMVELGEIAEIESENQDEQRMLSRLRLFPIPGQETIVKVDQLRELLSKKLGKEFVFIGNGVCLNPFYTRILQAEVVEKIKSAVLKHYQTVPFDDLKVILLDPLESIKIPYGDIELDVSVPMGKFSLSKLARIQVKLDGEPYFTKIVKIKLLAYMNILVARRNLKKNEKISKENTIFVKKIISDQPENYLTQKEQSIVMGMKLNASVRRGDPILMARVLSYQSRAENGSR